MVDGEIAKDTHPNAARVLTTLLEATVDKVDSLVSVQVEKLSKVAKTKDGGENDFQDFAVIEKSRPLLGQCYATEKPEENVAGELLYLGCLLEYASDVNCRVP